MYLQAEWKTVWIQISWLLRPYKKIPVFRVARPYLVKHQFFFRFSGKNIILCILKGKCLSKCIKLYFFFSRKKNILPTLPKLFRPVTRKFETHSFFYFASKQDIFRLSMIRVKVKCIHSSCSPLAIDSFVSRGDFCRLLITFVNLWTQRTSVLTDRLTL